MTSITIGKSDAGKAVKRGRPKLPEGDSLSEILSVRLSPDELRAIQDDAKRLGESVSELARDRLLARNGIPKAVLRHCHMLAARAIEAECELARRGVRMGLFASR